jgi:hypothetical protein
MLPQLQMPVLLAVGWVYLNTIRWHNGARYYARMAVKFWYAGKWRWDVGWFRSGYWVFPSVYPYL